MIQEAKIINKIVKKGFLMIELLYALLFLTIIFSSIAYYQHRSHCMAQDIFLHNQAVNQAKLFIDTMINNQEKKPVEQQSNNKFAVSYRANKLQVNTMELQKPLFLISVKVAWKGANGTNKSYELVMMSRYV
jgi:Tfp pilus assembly protein PilV